ncbi:hypothetical protein FB565_000989 [Actinoplanes lutulentus]|uniref:Integral membrane protein n=2 Tax=Actinoplanes lutulentus TaxID=1287878 RepID=A0A327ZAS2_9ACTN|nr:hypothetical protein [Actinoplanes lutulentus]MBB2941285.1 hypothetical protein [Actinoplanes lutulentus]RAK36777.1 hypothetical protein B0I29_10739 [Actinoplanes lutulentus]
MIFILVMVFLAGAPGLGWWAGRSSYLSDVRAEEWERTHVFAVTAQLVGEPASTPAGTVAPRAATAHWTAPDGTPRSGLVPVEPGSRSGDTIRVWVDDRGRLRGQPMDRDPMAQALMAAAAAVLCLAGAVAGLRKIGLGLLDRHRARAWQREWLAVGPLWSKDRR